MALLHVLSRLRRDLGFGLFAHGVDHGLRPESAAELDAVEVFAATLDVPFGRTRVDVGAGGNLQARARTARWDALRAAAARAGADRIATGHHADDRAETVLMRMLRGTGALGLGVLPAHDGDRIRPLLRARRADIEAHVRRHRIPHCDDPSNCDPRFLRVQVRCELMPVLERLNPRVVEHMCALADELAAAPALARAVEGGPGRLDAPTTVQAAAAELAAGHVGALLKRKTRAPDDASDQASGGADTERKERPRGGNWRQACNVTAAGSAETERVQRVKRAGTRGGRSERGERER
jgi:tRNA(Ile)-lysidine synthetase-like protein